MLIVLLLCPLIILLGYNYAVTVQSESSLPSWGHTEPLQLLMEVMNCAFMLWLSEAASSLVNDAE